MWCWLDLEIACYWGVAIVCYLADYKPCFGFCGRKLRPTSLSLISSVHFLYLFKRKNERTNHYVTDRVLCLVFILQRRFIRLCWVILRKYMCDHFPSVIMFSTLSSLSARCLHWFKKRVAVCNLTVPNGLVQSFTLFDALIRKSISQ